LRASLEVLAALLASEVDGSKAASLSREIRALEAELAELAPAKSVRRVDDLAAKRKARLSGAAGDDSPAVRK
jgi:hypothetical protein